MKSVERQVWSRTGSSNFDQSGGGYDAVRIRQFLSGWRASSTTPTDRRNIHTATAGIFDPIFDTVFRRVQDPILECIWDKINEISN